MAYADNWYDQQPGFGATGQTTSTPDWHPNSIEDVWARYPGLKGFVEQNRQAFSNAGYGDDNGLMQAIITNGGDLGRLKSLIGFQEPATAGDVDAPDPTNPGPGPGPGPAPAPPGGGGGGPLGGGLQTPGTFNVSSSWPGLDVPPVPTRPEFSYDPFSAPTLDQAKNEPGYQFARDEGIHAVENSKAARGILRTGGTLKDILGWGDRFAEQNYGNVYNRSANTYTMNRGNAFDSWKGNNDLAFDTWDRQLGGAQAAFAPKQRQAELSFDDMYRRFVAGLNATTAIATAGAN